MSSSPHSSRLVTELDHVRITKLLERSPAAGAPHVLAELMDNADLVPSREVPTDIVTMYSKVVVSDPGGGQRTLTLCYPSDADPATGAVSVLSPVGSALLGLKVGATAVWATPDGRSESAKLLEIAFQPEMNGEYEK